MSHHADIPHLFHSEYAGGPFENCAVCDKSLLEPDVVYSISKTCNQGEAIVEMAICEGCGEGLSGELSDASRQAVMEFVESKLMASVFESAATDGDESTPPILKLLAPPADPPEDPLELIAHCALCQKSRSDCRTFSITGFCVAGEMVVRSAGPLSLGFPSMVCDDCNTAVTSVLSKETRESFDRFYNDYVDTPPKIGLDGPVPVFGF